MKVIYLVILLFTSIYSKEFTFMNDLEHVVVDAKQKSDFQLEAILSLEIKSHLAQITDLVVTKDKAKFITVSRDKTIRVWNTKTGDLIRRIDPYIEENGVGEISSVVIDDKNNYLYVAGKLGSFDEKYKSYDSDQANTISAFDIETGKYIKSLHIPRMKGESFSPITELELCKETGTLYAATAKEIYVWDLNKETLLTTIQTNTFIRLKMISYIDDNKKYLLLITEKNIGILDISNKKVIKSFKGQKVILNIARNNKHIVVARVDNVIDVFDLELNHIDSILLDSMPGKLAFSSNGRWLAVGSGDRRGIVQVLDSSNGYVKVKENTKMQLLVNVRFLDDQTLILFGGLNHDIVIWDHLSDQERVTISGKSANIVTTKLEGTKIKYITAPPNPGRNAFNNMPLNTFDLKKRKFEVSAPDITSLSEMIPTKYKEYKLGVIREQYGMRKFYVVNVNKNNSMVELKSISKSMYMFGGFVKDKIVLANHHGGIDVFNLDGEQIYELIGHTDRILSLSLYKDTLLLSTSSDQTIRFWNLDNITSTQKLIISKIKDDSPADLAGLKTGDIIDKFNGNNVSFSLDTLGDFKKNSQHTLSFTRDDKMYTVNISDSNGSFGFAFQNNYYKKSYANLFISNDEDWIIWTNEGFFDASKNGAQYIGYHINQGPYKEAEYVTVENLYNTFYRPDLIRKTLNGESLEQYAKNINIEKLLKDGLAPEVHILSKTINTTNPDLDLKVQVCPKGNGGYDNLALSINDVPVQVINTSRALKIKKKSQRDDCFIYDQTISLGTGKNKIGFKATNKTGNIESKVDYLEVTFNNTNFRKNVSNKLQQAGDETFNDLHILAIAVNKYKDKELQLNYSINDATQMLNTIKDVAKPLFKNVHTYELFDTKVTKENIKQAFKDIKSKRDDVFLLYIAGHGITDQYNGNYYYIPYDFINKDDDKAVQNQGVGQKDFMLGLSNVIALKSLVLLDTCNSGSFVEADMQKTTTNRLAKATGRATISASSKSQVALEGFNDHGVFTYTLLEALRGKGYKKDGKITTNELSDYVEEILPDRTYKKWGYRQLPQKSMYGIDFSLGVKQ